MKPISQQLLLGRLQGALRHTGSVMQAAKENGIPYTTAQRWLEQANRPAAPKGIRKGALTEAQKKACFDGLSHAPASVVATQLKDKSIVEKLLNKSTVIRAAKAYASSSGTTLRYRPGPPQNMLSPLTKAKRVAFAMKHTKTSWKRVMFTDRKKFCFKYPGIKVGRGKWLKGNEVHEVATKSHADAYNIYMGLTPAGLTMAHVVAGTKGVKSIHKNKKGQQSRNITSVEYKEVMTMTLLTEGTKKFQGLGIASWVFQQDNDPNHRDAEQHIKEWNAKHYSSVSLLADWPPNSPDLNPIENVWAWMDAEVNKLGCKTFKEYKAALSKLAREIPQADIKNLYASMPERLALVIERNGGKTGY